MIKKTENMGVQLGGGKRLLKAASLGALMAFVITGNALEASAATYTWGTVTVDNVVSTPDNSSPVTVGKGADVVNITATGDTQTALKVDGAGAGAVGNVYGKDITIKSEAWRAVQAYNGATVNLGDASTESITISGTGDNTLEGDPTIFAKKGHININTKKLDITSHGMSAIHVQNNTELATAPENPASITINADDINVTSEKIGISAYSNGQINISGNLTVNAEDAIHGRGHATININEDGNHSTVLNGNIVFETDDDPSSGKIIDANVKINLTGEESAFTGRTYQYYNKQQSIKLDSAPGQYGNATGLNLTIADGASWNMTGDSFVNTVNVADGGAINMQKEATTLNSGAVALDNGAVNLLGSGQTVNVNDVSGTGTINTASVDNKVLITTVKEKTNLNVNGTAAVADAIAHGEAQLADLAAVVSTSAGGGDKSAASTVTTDEGTVVGAYFAKVNTDGQIVVDSIKETANSTNVGITEAASSLRLHWRGHMNDMNKRMGELRDSKGEHGVWARMTRGENEHKSVTAQYNLYQLGYDEKLSSDPTWTVGAALTHSDGNSSFSKGSTDDKATGVAIYGSKLNEDGSFLDLIAKYSRLDSDVKIGAANSDYSTNGYSLSAEYGKRFTQDSGLWIEPQVELTYGYLSGAEYKIDGRDVTLDGMKSLIGRLGFALGQNLGNEKGNVYVRASYLYDFDGETEGRFSDGNVSRTVEEDLGGGWWEVGVGTNFNFSKATHLYIDLEKTFGGEVETNWQWNAGIRYSF